MSDDARKIADLTARVREIEQFVRSLPPLQSLGPTPWPVAFGTLNADLIAGGSAIVSAENSTFLAHDDTLPAGMQFPSGAKVFCMQSAPDKRWYVVCSLDACMEVQPL